MVGFGWPCHAAVSLRGWSSRTDRAMGVDLVESPNLAPIRHGGCSAIPLEGPSVSRLKKVPRDSIGLAGLWTFFRGGLSLGEPLSHGPPKDAYASRSAQDGLKKETPCTRIEISEDHATVYRTLIPRAEESLCDGEVDPSSG